MRGQPPAYRLMRIRVRQSQIDAPLRMRWAVARFGALFVAACPLLPRFVPILFDERRRGLQDFLACSVVVHASD